MPRQISKEELKEYLLNGKKPKDEAAMSAVKDSLGVTPENENDPATTEDVQSDGQQFPDAHAVAPQTKEQSDAATDQLLTAEETKLAGQQPQQQAEAQPAQEQPEDQHKTLLEQHHATLAENDPQYRNQMSDTDTSAIPPNTPTDVPLAQAEANSVQKPTSIPEQGHTNTALKAEDTGRKEQAIADDNLKTTDPMQYVARKFGFGPGLGVDELAKAQKEANDSRFMTGLQEHLLGIGYKMKNLQMSPGDIEMFEKQKNEADRPVQQLEAQQQQRDKSLMMMDRAFDVATKNMNFQRQQALGDPNSPESRAVTKLMSKFLPPDMQDLKNDPDFQKLSALDQKEFIEKALEKKMQLDAAKSNKELANHYRDEALQTKKENFNRTEQDKVSKELNALSQSSRNAVGLAGRNMVSSDRAMGVLSDPNATPEDLKTIAQDISGIISGTPSVSGAKDQQYHTLAQTASSLWQTLSSEPQSVDAPELKQHLRDVISKMRDISTRTIHQNLHLVEAGHPAFAKENPEYFENYGRSMADVTATPDGSPKIAGNTPSPTTGGTVTVRRKSDGSTKTLPADKAAKYLTDAGYEKVN